MSKISRWKKTELPALKLNAKGEFHINVDGKKVYMGRELLVAKKISSILSQGGRRESSSQGRRWERKA